MSDHYDHVRLGLDKGGVIRGPATVVLENEKLMPLAEWLSERYGDRLKDELRKPYNDDAA